jgi:hypothetical protein
MRALRKCRDRSRYADGLTGATTKIEEEDDRPWLPPLLTLTTMTSVDCYAHIKD